VLSDILKSARVLIVALIFPDFFVRSETLPYQLKWEEKGVVASFSGSFTVQDNNETSMEIYNDSRSNNLRYVIWDLSGITEQLMTDSEAQSLAIFDKAIGSRLGQIKMAFVAADATSRFVCGRYTIHAIDYGVPWEFQAFDTFEKARKWCTS
jgi:hypothetical protein